MQICKRHNATVFGTASGGKHDRLREMGVAHCIDYRTQDFQQEVMRITDGGGVDIAIDAVGGKSFQKSYDCLDHMGRLYVFGMSAASSGTKRNLFQAVKTILSLPKFKPIPMITQAASRFCGAL